MLKSMAFGVAFTQTSRVCKLQAHTWRSVTRSPTRLSRAKLHDILAHVSFRAKKNAKGTDAAAAMTIQRWQRQLVHGRVESARAQHEAARRRWAVDKLHAAYARRWRFEVAARRDRRRKLEKEEEEVRFCCNRSRAWLSASDIFGPVCFGGGWG